MSNNPKIIIFFPIRLLSHIPYFAQMTYRNRTRKYRNMRDFYNKKSHQLLTLAEVAEYIGVSERQLLENLPKHERTE